MSLTPLELVICVLAAARATRLVTEDTIFDGPRDRVKQWAWNTNRGKLADLVGCPYCTGWWLSLTTYVAAVIALGRIHDVPWLAHAIECWAVMGGQMVVSVLTAALDGETKESYAVADQLKEDE